MPVRKCWGQFLIIIKRSPIVHFQGPSREYGIIGEGSQISTSQNGESTVFSLLIG